MPVRKRRKKNTLVPVVLLCLVVIASIILTGMILWNMTTEETAEIKNGSYHLKNAYIVGNHGDRIRVCYGEKLYEFQGKLKEEYTGIADIEVEEGKMTRCLQKPDSVEGILMSYSSKYIQIGDLGKCERNEEIPLYRQVDGRISGGSLGDLIVGVSRLRCVFENGKICALIQDGKQEIETIRVLIKDSNEEKWDELNLSASQEWEIGGSRKKKGEVCSVRKLFGKKKTDIVKAYCEKGSLYICDGEGKILGNGYAGDFIIHKAKKKFVLVNELPIETYVSCVLPSEMPAEYPLEALKAQAICARTFAYTQMTGDKYASYGANLDDSTDFQVYNKGERTERSNRAAAETAGQMLSYKNKPTHCYYYSASPGVTGDLSLWEDKSPAYLKAVSGLKNPNVGDLTKEKAFVKYIQASPASWDSKSPYYRWNAEVEMSAISDEQKGRLKKVLVKKRSRGGYVTKLILCYEQGKTVLKNENQIRRALGQRVKNLVLSDGSTRDFDLLPSACFAVREQKNGILYLRGGGFGHGIGMSQTGAGSLGEAGKTCQEILNFYYPGTAIKNME